MEKIKELKDLDLVDRFLFAEVMEDEGSLADVLEIILGREVVLKGLPQVEKEFRKNVWSRQVRTIKASEEIGIKFMNEWEEKMLERKEGREEGRAEGEQAKQREIAEKMIAMGMDIPTVSEATGLSEDEVRELKKSGR